MCIIKTLEGYPLTNQHGFVIQFENESLAYWYAEKAKIPPLIETIFYSYPCTISGSQAILELEAKDYVL